MQNDPPGELFMKFALFIAFVLGLIQGIFGRRD